MNRFITGVREFWGTGRRKVSSGVVNELGKQGNKASLFQFIGLQELVTAKVLDFFRNILPLFCQVVCFPCQLYGVNDCS